MFKFFYLILLIITTTYSTVLLKAPSSFYKDDSLIFTIEASGSSIKFPEINKIDDFIVTKLGSSSSISIINGVRKSTLIQEYRLYPTKNITIPSFKVTIDNKDYFTDKKKIILLKAKKTVSNDMEFSIDISNKDLYVGQQSIVKIVFKYRKNIPIVDLRLGSINFDNIWSKQISEPKQYEKNGFNFYEISYIVFPQKSGKLTIEPKYIDVSIIDQNRNSFSFWGSAFGTPTKTKKVYSNKINLDIKPLPSNVLLLGQFIIESNIDRTNINLSQAVNLNIQIKGSGNIDDIEELKLNIPNATIYSNKGQKEYRLNKQDQYGGIYKKSFSIVPNDNITIPSISLKYFDNIDQKIKELKTTKYKIVVNNNKIKQDLNLYKKQLVDSNNKQKVVKEVKLSYKSKLLYFLAGIIFTILIYIMG